jgi:hypothetical protein
MSLEGVRRTMSPGRCFSASGRLSVKEACGIVSGYGCGNLEMMAYKGSISEILPEM